MAGGSGGTATPALGTTEAPAGMPARPTWQQAWERLGLTPPPGLLDQLVARYAEPHRAYHTMQHITECFAVLEPAAVLARDLGAVQLALWFHDAIYDTRAHDNEARSAAWARTALREAGAAARTADRVHELIMATTHRATPEDPDARLLVDVDLSIFGAAFAVAYGASKGGIVQMTKGLATAWAKDNIQANAILPGWIDTEFTRTARQQVAGLNETVLSRTPAKRWGTPEDFAGVAIFLASAASDFVTGAVIAVDGGFSSQG